MCQLYPSISHSLALSTGSFSKCLCKMANHRCCTFQGHSAQHHSAISQPLAPLFSAGPLYKPFCGCMFSIAVSFSLGLSTLQQAVKMFYYSLSPSPCLSVSGLYHLRESESCMLAVNVNAHLSRAYSTVEGCQALSALLALPPATDNKSNIVKQAGAS